MIANQNLISLNLKLFRNFKFSLLIPGVLCIYISGKLNPFISSLLPLWQALPLLCDVLTLPVSLCMYTPSFLPRMKSPA